MTSNVDSNHNSRSADKMDDSTPEERAQRPVSGGGRDFLEGFLDETPAEEASDPTQAETAVDLPGEHHPELQVRVIEALQSIFDPEIPVNIYELGLIYSVAITEDKVAKVIMTLTTPHCPVAESMPGDVQMRVEAVEGVKYAVVDLVWEPPWDPSRMSEAAQLELGFI